MAQHDWHLVDAEKEVYCRLLSDGMVELQHSDSNGNNFQLKMSWEEFNKWRGGDDDES